MIIGSPDAMVMDILSTNQCVAEFTGSQVSRDFLATSTPSTWVDSGAAPVSDFDSSSPWFKTFRESLLVRNIPGIRNIAEALPFSDSKITREDSANIAALLKYRLVVWNRQVEVRQKQLRSEFHSGICGCRAGALRNASSVKLSLMGSGSTDENKVSMLGSHKTRSQSALAELTEPASLSSSSSCSEKRATIPDIAESHNSREITFIDRNRLIDPLIAESERRVAVWTVEEVKTFLERYAIHPKNFKRIASHLPDKWESDCVELYYRFKIALNLKRFTPGATDGRRKTASNPGSQKILNQLAIDESVKLFKSNAAFYGMVPNGTIQQVSIGHRDLPAVTEKPANTTMDEEEERKYMIDCIQYISAHFKAMLPVFSLPAPSPMQNGEFSMQQVLLLTQNTSEVHNSSEPRLNRPSFPFAIPLGYE